MNAGEILELVRAGYTRAEIDAMSAPEEKHDDPQPEQMPAWARALNESLEDLRKTMQAANIQNDDMGDENDVVDAAENALAQYITGKAPESKSKGGRKTK